MSVDEPKPVRRPLSVVGSIGSRRTNSETSTLRRQSLAALSFLAENDPAALSELADVYDDPDPRSSIDTAKTGSDNPFSSARISGLTSSTGRADEDQLSGEESSDGGSAWHVDDHRTSSSTSATRRSGSRLSRRSSGSRNSSDRRLMSASKLARVLGTTRGEVLQRVVRPRGAIAGLTAAARRHRARSRGGRRVGRRAR